MLVPGIDSIPQDPSIPVTGGLHGVGEDVFMLPFPKPVALRVSHAALTGLAPSLPALPLDGGALRFLSSNGSYYIRETVVNIVLCLQSVAVKKTANKNLHI